MVLSHISYTELLDNTIKLECEGKFYLTKITVDGSNVSTEETSDTVCKETIVLKQTKY